ncbi:MAG: 16S rRNA (guanine(966)-N(2))-methyltransferase RsmD [Coriobacteriaceae bacterium]|nr:16S rRNA (guanine(966)-N(2))-methyltransferase RsmD [Coriobacteriaceae bacterium]
MRIVAGTHRGRVVDAPDGSDTRPTTDRVREALFSTLFSIRGGFDGAVVLDAFAGSGALGFEALSRGAACAVFYEKSRSAANVVRKNAKSLGFSADQAHVVEADAMAHMRKPPAGAGFDLVFLDPPYSYDCGEVLGSVFAWPEGTIADGAIIVYEHALKDGDAVASACEKLGIEVLKAKKYGKTSVAILQTRS